jgi:hypothetical protein
MKAVQFRAQGIAENVLFTNATLWMAKTFKCRKHFGGEKQNLSA